MKRPVFLSLAAVGLIGLTVPQLLPADELSKKEMRQAKRKAKGRDVPGKAVEKEFKPLELAPLSSVKNPAPVERNRDLALSWQQVQQRAAGVDQEIAAKLAAGGLKRNAPSSDGVFVRRIYLDAVGRIPSPAEAKSFVEDADPKKTRRSH